MRETDSGLHSNFGSEPRMRARIKNGHPPKICERCARPFEWRKKWARDWPNVKYCSQACRSDSRGG